MEDGIKHGDKDFFINIYRDYDRSLWKEENLQFVLVLQWW